MPGRTFGLRGPAAVAAGVGLLFGASWARAAVFGVVGWFALVPPSVAAMALVKVVRGDPHATVGDTAVFVVVTLIFWVVAAVLFARLRRPDLRASAGGQTLRVVAPQPQVAGSNRSHRPSARRLRARAAAVP